MCHISWASRSWHGWMDGWMGGCNLLIPTGKWLCPVVLVRKKINMSQNIYYHFLGCHHVIFPAFTVHHLLLLKSGLMFPAVSDHILMKVGLSGKCLERGGNAKRLFDAQVLALDRRIYITWGKRSSPWSVIMSRWKNLVVNIVDCYVFVFLV